MTKEKLDLDQFVREQRAKLTELRALVEPRHGALDLTYESLDRLEAFYREILEGARSGIDEKALRPELGRYIGETLLHHTKGIWAVGGEGVTPRPAVRVPGIAKHTFEPIGAALEFRRLRRPGIMREETEKWDLALRRADLARLVEHRDAELDQLRAHVERVAGTSVAKLDASARSLGLVQQAWQTALAPDVSPAARRELQRRVMLLVGELFAEAIGGDATWSVNADADDAEFAEFQIGGWTPVRAFRHFKADTPAGTLHANLAAEIKNKKGSKP